MSLGDSAYPLFCKAAIDLDERLQALGAKPIVSRGVGDDQTEGGWEAGFEDWQEDYWKEMHLPSAPVPTGIPAPSISVTEVAASEAPVKLIPSGFAPVPLISNRRITPEDYDRDIRHMIFDLSGVSDLKYQLGDCLAIFPQADPQVVHDFLHLLHLNENTTVRLTPVNTSTKLPPGFPAVASLQQLFTSVIDLSARPSRRFLGDLSAFATDSNEKETLLRLRNDKQEYRRFLNEKGNYFDLLKMFPSTHAQLTLPHLLSLFQSIIMKPRYYSIASCFHKNASVLELCVAIVDWKTSQGEKRVGLCTNYLQHLDPSSSSPVFVNCAIRRCKFFQSNLSVFPYFI